MQYSFTTADHTVSTSCSTGSQPQAHVSRHGFVSPRNSPRVALQIFLEIEFPVTGQNYDTVCVDELLHAEDLCGESHTHTHTHIRTHTRAHTHTD